MTDIPTDHNHSKVTIREVARRAGVSISSVSRALSDHPHVSPTLRARVESAAQALGYQPDFLAQRLRRGDTASVGFLVGAISNPIMADIYTSSSNVLAAEGYAMILACSQNQPESDRRYLHFFAQRQVSGLILSTAADGPDSTGDLLHNMGIPTVMLDRAPYPSPLISAVQSDHRTGIEKAVHHLWENGHRRIALIGGAEHFFPAANRLAAFHRTLELLGSDADPALIHSAGMSREVGYHAVQQLLALPQPPTALIAGGNLILAGVLQALHEHDIAIGRDMALVGCDDTELTRLHTPPITVISRDLALLGETAGRLLLAAMQQKGGETVTLPTHLLIRDSSFHPVIHTHL
ncbi:MAG: LacI family DNA-binding transcriptional regulator [Caldilineaceae bacterium]|nr:LacI family DNA-binding transcriptional regulator [Caldilineaceae bacterium]